ncbi:MAG: PEP-CTERM sorting domain-containing protein [Candidatus Tritonobacter lacicola]|nr:PEP-CTERM sorting domain-containing protein [Candidatus Tritonobacter lacicola]
MKPAAKIIVSLLAAAVFFPLASPALGQHWTPPGWWPGPYGHTVWGQVTFCGTLDTSDQAAAFRVSDDALVGLCYITVNGGFWYNMVIHALTTASVEVYFLVWDGTQELNAYTNFTAGPQSPPPETQHGLSCSEGAVPEPSTIMMLIVSFGSAYFFRKRIRSRPV